MRIIYPSSTLRSPLVAGIPHSSSLIPPEAIAAFAISHSSILEEQRLLTDWFTDELYSEVHHLGGVEIVHEVSRFVVDPERFSDDSKEIMASRGMGVIYEQGCFGQVIKGKVDLHERELLLSRYYWPYHEALTSHTAAAIQEFGYALFVDCHSYPASPLPYELMPAANRPDIAIGTDPSHTPPGLIEELRRICHEADISFGLDEPFSGTLVPNTYYGDSRVVAFMIEVNRGLYMDEKNTRKRETFKEVQSVIGQLLNGALQFCR